MKFLILVLGLPLDFANRNSDGWCIQGGYITWTSNPNLTITLLKQYKDTNYTVIVSDSNIGLAAINSRFTKIISKTVNTFVTNGCYQNGGGTDYAYFWKTEGYIN